ncbi:hypothetical protein NU195Hw_Modified_638t1 [Hortaea werneckii]
MPAEATWEYHFLAKYLEARHRRLSSAGFLERYVGDHTYSSSAASSRTASSPGRTESLTEGEVDNNLPFRLPVIREESNSHGQGRGSITEQDHPRSGTAVSVTVASKATV